MSARTISPPAGIRAVVRRDEPLSKRTTLRIGGPARFLVEVHDAGALAAVLRWAAEEGLPVRALGKGSNVLVPDEGWPGVALVLGGDFNRFTIDGTRVTSGGGVSLMALAVATKNAGLSGLENLSGIPSSMGGAVRINAGSYGTEIFELLVSVDLVSRSGAARSVPAAEIPHGYRWTALVESDDVVCGCLLELRPKPREEIEARFREVTGKRKGALPRQPNAGSIFKNPPGRFAGKLLEECGLKGRRVGGAEISAVHANVIVNLGGATAADVRALMDLMRSEVRARFGVELVPEIDVLEPRGVSRDTTDPSGARRP